ncbi:MAG: YicC family protein [Bacteroidales bacterium]|jgi:uncharacterized protein (TIGR00255 family)|nr:YicC family protein [Bacteroidales bacterium]
MLVSMTGFGKATVELSDKKITIEIKSLNSKQTDLNMKIPALYRERELEIRNMISTALNRGKIDCGIFYEVTDSERSATVNKEVVKGYYNQLKSVADEIGIELKGEVMQTLMRMPDTLKSERPELTDNEWIALREGVQKAISLLIDFRKQEGNALAEDLKQRVSNIEKYLKEALKYEGERLEKVKSRITDHLSEVEGSSMFDANRFEQEMIYYIEKYDITEEKVRLENHLKYFMSTMNNEEINGKKLGFISQEIGREINTLGSKANHADIQQLVVNMKDELEKIKEQVLNVL